MDSLEVKVQLAPFVVNTIQKTKWLYRLRDRVLEILSLPVTIALILKIFSFCGCQEQFYIIDWARKVTGGLRSYFLKPPSNFFFYFTPDNQSSTPWKFCEIVLHPLEIPQRKTKTLGNST